MLKHDGFYYVDVVGFVDSIVHDLMKTPPEMVASRDQIIAALKMSAQAARAAMESEERHG